MHVVDGESHEVTDFEYRFSMVYLLLATILTHFVPISVIIYVYRPQ